MSQAPSARANLRARSVRSPRSAAPEAEATTGPPLNPTARYVLIGLAILSVGLLALIAYPFASALLFAAVLAGALHPWQESLSARLRDRRQVAAALLCLAVLLLLVLPVATITVSLGRQVVEGVGYVRDTLSQGGLPALVEKLPPRCGPWATRCWASSRRQGQQQIEELAGNQTGRAAAAVGGILSTTSDILFQVR